jgi:hypothetical protein
MIEISKTSGWKLSELVSLYLSEAFARLWTRPRPSMHVDHADVICRDCMWASCQQIGDAAFPVDSCSSGLPSLLPRRQQSASALYETGQPVEASQMGTRGSRLHICCIWSDGQLCLTGTGMFTIR